MDCAGHRDLLSAYIDDDLRPLERLRVEGHLRECAACRRHHRQMVRAVGLLRGLDRQEAPQFRIQRARGQGPAARARRWAEIRSRTLAPPQPSLRPIALAVMAFLVVAALFQAVDRLSGPQEGATGGPGEAPAPLPADAGSAGADDRPDWLKREIARRVLAAREAQQTDPGGAGPALPRPGDQGVAALQPPVRPPATAGEEADGDGMAEAPAEERPATRIARGGTEELPEEEALRAGTPPATPGDPEESEPAASTQSDAAAALTVVTLAATPPAAPPATPASEAGPATADRSRPSAATPLPAGAPAPPEPAASLDQRIVARLVLEDEEPRLEFEDLPEHTPGLDGTEGEVVEDATPEPDPRTGVRPPVPLQRPPLALAGRGRALRRQEILAPLAMRLLLGAEGEVADLTVVSPSGLDWLDQALAQAVRRWRFRPAERDAAAVSVQVDLVIDFDLEPAGADGF